MYYLGRTQRREDDMAKTKDGTKKTDKPKVKIPKEIAGFKVPKELRKKGEALIERANSPEGRQAIASGLAMVGGLVAANAARKAEAKASETAKPAAASPEAPQSEASKAETKPETPKPGTPGINPQQMADQIGAAADMLLGRIFAKR
ncbi:hypothetical protein [Sphingomonas ginsenosidivorax]|uniref:hypothetical protein n=1 Tax=Sphingomonas ginsenosidivorax TaxID=862135 RepID=UPI0013157BD3|nr:hypothetical protein [Sphingomonas ginsenosidivorax]